MAHETTAADDCVRMKITMLVGYAVPDRSHTWHEEMEDSRKEIVKLLRGLGYRSPDDWDDDTTASVYGLEVINRWNLNLTIGKRPKVLHGYKVESQTS